MSLVEDLPCSGQQCREMGRPHQLFAAIPGPIQQSFVDLENQSVGIGGNIAAGSLIVKFFGTLLQQCVLRDKNSLLSEQSGLPQIVSNGFHGLLGSAQIRTMPGRLQPHELAAGKVFVDVFAHCL